MTIGQLFNECMVQMNKGNADKEVYISSDDEGNSFHGLFFGFTELNPANVQEFTTSHCEDLHPDKHIILG